MKTKSLLLLLFIVVACSTPRNTGYKPESKTYKREANTINPEFIVHHINDTISELNFKIRSKELLYTRPDGINFSSNLLISFRLTSNYDAKEFSDSSSVRLVDQNNDGADKFLIGKIKMRVRTLKNYFLRATISDLNRNTQFTKVLFVQKDNDINRQNFMVQSSSKMLMFNNIIKSNEQVSIIYKDKISVKLFVRYYNRNFALALPPFSETEVKPFEYQPDSTFEVQLKNGVVDFAATKKGFYHFQLDTTQRDGLTLFNFSETFPNVKKIDELTPPLRFITSKNEFEELSNGDRKAAADKFWLSCTAGNMERSKDLIRKFYNRVQDANIHFTSYVEGWKTDRGMIFLIQGPPNVIYRDGTRENWVYGEENSVNSVSYLFSKVTNPFTDNDYELERSPTFKPLWFASVDAWRQGRIYLQNN
ncbi:MAG TPA: GWxTD domain-containing protein [Bacteroidia bacterium]|jgi:GWxTD domain-containing protein|nr:GWxTD domain-containing protein [Bacteroidia bacterium]HRG52188.1 GWxTD domain-containing protein [Bacteroidia bacterium]